MRLVPLQTPWAIERLGLQPANVLTEMKVVTFDGRVLGGADALVYLARFVWWAWPLAVLGRMPGARPVLRCTYRWLAARRHCSEGGCRV